MRKFLKFKGGGYLSFLALFTVIGIFVGVCALILVLGVMSGFHSEIKRRILGITPHIVLHKFFEEPVENYKDIILDIKEIEGITEVLPYALAKVMIKKKNFVDGGIIRSILPNASRIDAYLKENIKMGNYEIGKNKVIVGWDLANRLRVTDGETITVYSPFDAKMTPFGPVMKARKFVVSGIFDVGYYDYNATFLFCSLDEVQKLLGYNENTVQGFEIFLREPYNAQNIGEKIEKKLSYPFTTLTWIEMNRSLFSALKLEKIAMFLVLILILFVASFNIMTTLLMLLMKKTREIGILRSLGLARKNVFNFFLIEGFYLGTIGIFSGLIFGTSIGIFATKYKIIRLPPDIYFIDYLPIEIKFADIIWISVAAFLIVFLSILYPARKATKLFLRDALRYE